MHVVTKLVGVTVLIMIGAAITAFTPALRWPISADGFFTLRDVVEEVLLPIVFAVANYLLYVYLSRPTPSATPRQNQEIADLAALVLLVGVVVASLGVGIRFVGDELATSYCTGSNGGSAWCDRADLFHQEMGHLGLLVGNLLVGAGLLICQLCHGEVEDLTRANRVYLGVLGVLCGTGIFALVVEGRITEFGLPLLSIYALVTVVACRVRRSHLQRLPLLGYQTIAVWVALVLVVLWGLYWRGFPQFTTLNLAVAPK